MSDNELEHWSSPDGCHESCPACEAERTDEERAEHAARMRVALYAPELLAALQALMADMEDVEDDRNPETGEVYSACIQAREAISKAKGAP